MESITIEQQNIKELIYKLREYLKLLEDCEYFNRGANINIDEGIIQIRKEIIVLEDKIKPKTVCNHIFDVFGNGFSKCIYCGISDPNEE